MANAILITPTGDVTEEQVNGLEDFQQHVGGYVEALSSDDGDHTIWLNEEGKIAGLPVNSKGHRIVHELTILAPDDVIVLSLIHISEPTRLSLVSRMPSSA